MHSKLWDLVSLLCILKTASLAKLATLQIYKRSGSRQAELNARNVNPDAFALGRELQ